MPAFGYILLLNENVHQVLTIKYDSAFFSWLPQLWRIWLLFYGSFALAIATLLYARYCPPQIKQYGSPFEMANAETDHRVRLENWEPLFKSVRGSYKEMSDAQIQLTELPKREFGKVNSFGTDWPTRISNLLIYEWTAANLNHPVLRSTTLVLYGIGLGLIGIPAIVTFIQVTFLLLTKFAA